MSSEQQSAQHRTISASRPEAFRSTSSLRRLGTFWTPRDRGGDDAHPDVPDLPQEEDEEERSLGLPWVQLESLFGQDVHSLGMETVNSEGEVNSPLAMKWSRDNIRQLIDAFGTGTLSDTNQYGVTLVHMTLVGRQLKCAKLLFDYAAEQGAYVNLRWRDEDILGWSIRSKSRRLAEFVLQRMTEQCASPEETAGFLRDHFEPLVKQFPQVMQKFIMNDKFCFEYGRIDVPQSLFANRPNAPIAVLDAAPSSWRPKEGNEEIKEFWKQKGISDFIDLDSTSDTKIPAASKFLCLDLSKVQDQQMIFKSILSAKYPVGVFKTQFIKNFVQWRWILRVRGDTVVMLVFDAFSSSLFFLFVAIAWDGEPRYSHAEKQLARSALVAALGTKRLPIAAGRLGGIFHVVVMFYLLIAFDDGQTTEEHFQFVASVQCILCLLALMEDLKPFHLTGPFISMIGYVLADIRPFMVLGTLMIVTFGAAFRILFAVSQDEKNGQNSVNEDDGQNSVDEDDRRSFRNLWRSFESTFHATLGQFDTEDLHEASGSFISFWRSLFFNLFLFMAAIVLLSLLIAVLGDTCDRVILSREAESIKSRATCLTRKALKEYKKTRAARANTGMLRRMLYASLDLLCGMTRFFFRMVLWFLFLSLVIAFAGHFLVGLAIILAVLVSEVMAALLRKEGSCLERLVVRDPFLRRLNSQHVQSDVSVFWFLVPVTSSTPNSNPSWEGRLVAMSRLISDRLKKSEENQGQDIARLEGHIMELEASQRQQMQCVLETQERLIRIEQMLFAGTNDASCSTSEGR